MKRKASDSESSVCRTRWKIAGENGPFPQSQEASGLGAGDSCCLSGPGSDLGSAVGKRRRVRKRPGIPKSVSTGRPADRALLQINNKQTRMENHISRLFTKVRIQMGSKWKMETSHHYKNTNEKLGALAYTCTVHWHIPVLPDEAGGSRELRSSRPAWET
jgi:hypothetical protein